MKACPTGWHLPSDTEWNILVNHFGSGALKSTSGWKDGGNGTNSSGFTGLPAGYRNYNGTFAYVGMYGSFWSSTELDGSYAWGRYLDYDNSALYRHSYYKGTAFSCRCVRD